MPIVALCAAVFLTAASFSQSAARKLIITPNPGCGNCTDSYLRLLQVESCNDVDCIIYLLSSFGPPTLLTARFNTTTNVEVSWSCLKNGSSNCIKFGNKPSFTSAFAINRLIEYDDSSDISDVTTFARKANSVRSTYLSQINWQPVTPDPHMEPRWKFYLNRTNDYLDLVIENATSAYFSIDFAFFDEEARTQMYPSILHSDSAGMFDIIAENLTTHFNSSRFALEIVTVTDALPGTSDVSNTASVDDEYSPGVFQTVTWMMNTDATEETPSTYIHYKPVSYTKQERNLESIQPVHISKVRFYNYDDLKATGGGLTYAYFSDDIRLRNVQSANFSIGSQNDGFYAGYNLITFTGIYGVGKPAQDQMSAEVLAAILVGVGVPAVLILSSIVVVLYRMLKKRNSGNSPVKPFAVNDSITT